MGAIRYRSVLTREPLTYDVQASNVDGTLWTPPVGATFEVAYLTSAGNPASGDWKTGAFGTSRIGTVLGYAVVGPGSVIGALAKGTYYEWARATDPVLGVVAVKCAGELVMQ